MPDNLIWFAAYPKTGSTWVRHILRQLLAPGLPGGKAVPSFHKTYPDDAPEFRVRGRQAKILRTHTHPEHKLFRRLEEEQCPHVLGIMTICRHPLDVMLSQLNYAATLDDARFFKDQQIKPVEAIIADGEIAFYIDAFIEAGGAPAFKARCISIESFYRAWWAKAAAGPALHLRYEDMIVDRPAAVQQVAGFLNVEGIDPEAIVERIEKASQINGQFYWRKTAYNFRQLLEPNDIARFESGFADTLAALGYAS